MPTHAVQSLPCLSCSRGQRAINEVIVIYLRALNGAPPPEPDGRAMRFLPRTCCRQPPAKADAKALVA